MPKQKLNKTKYPSIFWYDTQKGKSYAIRVRYKDNLENWKEKTEQGFKTLTQAKNRKAELESSTDNEVNVKITFGEWWLKHLAIVEPMWSRNSHASMMSLYQKHLNIFDNVELAKLTLYRYQQFINQKLHDENLALESVRSIHRAMMAILNSAVKHDVLMKNKLRDVTIQKLEIAKKKHLSLDELSRLDVLARDKLSVTKYACYILMRIGWRRGEALGLTKRAIRIIDDDTIEVSVIETKTAKMDKNTPKTRSSFRTNTLTGNFAQAILDAVSFAEKIHGNGFDDASRIIVNSEGATYCHVVPNTFLTQLSEELGVHVSPHMLRHSFATHAIADNASVVEVAKWIGHANPKMTLDIYSHSTDEARNSLVKYANTPTKNPTELVL